jgi:curved DNA-binding protein CbpA
VEFKDYYAVLGVPRDATADQVKKAWRRLARKYHPDVSQEPDAAARMSEINEANAVLSDPEKRAAYDALAKETGFRLIPCGDAMELARLDPAWGRFESDPAFDPKTAVYPALPKGERRSLHSGYSWKKNEKTGRYALGKDAFHANTAGEYLLGCVWLEFFFGQSAVGNGFTPKGMTAEEAAILQKVAHRAVSEKQRPDVAP